MLSNEEKSNKFLGDIGNTLKPHAGKFVSNVWEKVKEPLQDVIVKGIETFVDSHLRDTDTKELPPSEE